jgi:hypothetical protein
MKIFSRPLLIIVVCAIGVAHGQTTENKAIDAKLWGLKAKIEAQIERIKLAKTEAENDMELARLRIGDQLRRSEEKLELQVEKLTQYQQAMNAQLTETSQALEEANNNLHFLVEEMASEVDGHMESVNGLISRIRNTRKGVLNPQYQAGASKFDKPAGAASKPVSSMKRIYLTPAQPKLHKEDLLENITEPGPGQAREDGDCGSADTNGASPPVVESPTQPSPPPPAQSPPGPN